MNRPLKFRGILANASFLALAAACYSCDSGKIYLKIHKTDPREGWNTSQTAYFAFSPIAQPNDVDVVWLSDGADADNLQPIQILLRTKKSLTDKFFLDTITLSPQNSTLNRQSGNMVDMFTPYCKNATFGGPDQQVQIEISPLHNIKGLHYIGVEVSNAKPLDNQ